MKKVDWSIVSLFLFIVCIWQTFFLGFTPRTLSNSYVPHRLNFISHKLLANNNNTVHKRLDFDGERQNRVAILVPYMGDHLPTWFDAFMFSTLSSYYLIDWFIFLTDAPLRPTPPNIKLIKLSRSELYTILSKVDSNGNIRSRMNGSMAMELLVENLPYILVELKPCLGYLFQSAEGCYSKVIANEKNVSVYISASQFSDAYYASSKDKESFALGWILTRCFQRPLLLLQHGNNYDNNNNKDINKDKDDDNNNEIQNNNEDLNSKLNMFKDLILEIKKEHSIEQWKQEKKVTTSLRISSPAVNCEYW
eukprot:gene10400-21685_t